MRKYSLGIDIGGTFVDAIVFDRQTGDTRLEKALTTPENPSTGVLRAIDKLAIDLGDVETIVHGTTLGLNAVIERRGAKTGIVTNRGFRDILELGRGDLPPDHMYDLHYQRPEPLVRRRRIAGVPGRITVGGDVEVELDEGAVIESVAALIEEQGIESLAISCLHSYRNPVHEREIEAAVRERFPELSISVSHRVVREHREYERTCTTVIDAYIRPIFERYIDDLRDELESKGFTGMFLIMRSSGGAMTADAAKFRPLDSVLSGPAGGIIGASHLARELDLDQVLSMDFGGTSLDTCVIENGEAGVIHETRLQHMPVLIPAYDIRCIGAGGGSIAWLEEGMLRLGPHSAGADPGPVSYGRGGTQPALTDAALVLGFIDPARFLDGQLPLDSAAAESALERELSAPLQSDVISTAAGVFSVLIAQTEGAVREITVEQGKDPRDFTIMAFGGAGPLIAPLLALEMGIPSTIVPNVPAVFSAWGMLMTDLATDVSRTLVVEVDDDALPGIKSALESLEGEARQNLAAQGVGDDDQIVLRNLEMRYAGQEHTLKIPVDSDFSRETLRRSFDAMHQERYGHESAQALELVNLRVTGLGRMPKPELHSQRADVRDAGTGASSDTRRAYCFKEKRMTDFELVERRSLAPGDRIAGPAIIDEGTSTTVIYTSQSCNVDDLGQLLIETPPVFG